MVSLQESRPNSTQTITRTEDQTLESAVIKSTAYLNFAPKALSTEYETNQFKYQSFFLFFLSVTLETLLSS